ncbi:MAG: hypothetical protein IKE66_16305 [Hyphomicrobium sp.]|nr:hypothetical protein [Hyphomicrobium sp.]
MFGVFKKAPPKNARVQRIDLASVRDTLAYIESDLDTAPELQRVAEAVRAALAEIDRIELTNGAAVPAAITDARFVPIGV